MKTFVFLAIAVATMAISLPAMADGDIEYPAPTPGYPFQRSFRTDEFVAIPPYHRPFVVRIYTTPAQQPYYNVPPYAVVAPY